jgi:hypothetical protein
VVAVIDPFVGESLPPSQDILALDIVHKRTPAGVALVARHSERVGNLLGAKV